MVLKNTMNLSIETLKKALERHLKDYQYEMMNGAIVVTDKSEQQLNVLVDDEEIELIEAVPFKFKLIFALVITLLTFIGLEFTTLHWGFRIPIFLFAFLTGGAIADAFHKYRFQAIYVPMKEQIQKVVYKLDK